MNNLQNSVNKSSGKSGSFFLFTKDKRLSIKTIKKSERQIMINFLKDYHQHVTLYEDSLLCRVFGVFTIKIPGVADMEILLMQNVFYLAKPCKILDIKGSTEGRTSRKNGAYSGPFKDLDFLELGEQLMLRMDDIDKLEFNLLKDVKLLKKNNLMDYSMLVGSEDCCENSNNVKNSYFSLDNKKVYTLGIIDFLTEYGYWKSIERKFNAIRYGSNIKKISVADPSNYSNRFFNFIFGVIIPVVRKNSSFLSKVQ